MARRKRRSKKSNFKGYIGLFIVFIILASISECSNSSSSRNKSQYATETPENIETMVKQIMNYDATKTQQAILSYTPTPTNTPAPTHTKTLIPTRTPWPTPTHRPTRTPTPYLSGQTFSDSSYTQSNSGILGSTSRGNSSCVIKGNINSDGEKIYHCPNDQWYSRTKINTSKGERWFCSEAEALTAGFRAPQGAPPCGGF